jgi:cbb3-type cytochrome oxidase subunit 3
MEAIFLQLFISFGLVFGSLLLFAFSTGQREADHADRLALFPLDDSRDDHHEDHHVDHD